MIKALLIDDEPLARSLVREYLQPYTNITVVSECDDGFEGVKAIQQFQPDLVFLDVQMPKINGFEMLELVDPLPSVIFTTAFDEYATRAFEANAVDYLLKPFSRERFDRAVQKWLNQYQNGRKQEGTNALLGHSTGRPEEQNRLVVKYGNNIRIIPASEIYYLEAYDDYVKVHTREDCYLKKRTMAYFEEVFRAKDFLRVHRSYIVQLSCITRIEPYEKNGFIALLKNGKKIPLSRSGYARLKEALGM